MSEGCVASLSSVASVVTSRAPGQTSATRGWTASDQTASVPSARWAAGRRARVPLPPTPLQLSLAPGNTPGVNAPSGVSRPTPGGSSSFMAQSFICIDCGRSVDHVTRARCDRCRPQFDKERHAKHGDRTGRKSAARNEHQAFITSTAWRRVSRLVRLRDGACVECGATSQLTAHHLVPVRVDPSLALDPDNCITLCRRCHGRAERRPRGGGSHA